MVAMKNLRSRYQFRHVVRGGSCPGIDVFDVVCVCVPLLIGESNVTPGLLVVLVDGADGNAAEF